VACVRRISRKASYACATFYSLYARFAREE
jgi:hypothetical protein